MTRTASSARVLTIRQPWATLIALGVKTIETRSYPTKYRGPVLIHAGAHRPEHGETVGDWRVWRAEERKYDAVSRVGELWSRLMPLGAVVAIADLADCLPIIGCDQPPPGKLDGKWRTFIDLPSGGLRRWYWEDEDPTIIDPTAHILLGLDITDQLPYGDFTDGRYGWLLTNIRPLHTPVAHKGRLGLRHAPTDLTVAALQAAT